MSDSEWGANYRFRNAKEAKKTEGGGELGVASTACVACGHLNPLGSRFCVECGSAIADTQKCPKCDAITHPGADICERCGTWLLRGKCKFCLAEISEDDTFCGSCGNPQAGITCPSCELVSIFDFCRKCDIPLSREAREQATRTKADPNQQQLLAALKAIAAIDERKEDRLDPESQSSAATAAVRAQLLQMQLVRERAASGTAARTDKTSHREALFSAKQQEQVGLLGAQIQAEEEQRRKLLEQVEQVLREMSAKTFSSSQAARRYYMSIISALPEEARSSISLSGRLRWRCHAYSTEHSDPSGCADPSKGGVWFIT